MSNSELIAELEVERDRRVLSIQSHVVHGYAGNKCSVFPLQLHGFEVDFINSVQFSNHAGYEHVKGQKLTEKELEELYEGLMLNKINNYTHVLTGYCGNVTFLQKIADVIRDLKQKDPNTTFVCDPVMGDNGRYYTPKELMPVYRDTIIPLADVLTPNAFELGELTGIAIETEKDCLRAVDILHESGVQTIVVTSGVTGAQTPESLRCYASVKGDATYRFTFPRLIGQFVGTGE
uniref:pyridoxal kinase n=1 Tax=Caenorhabditis japonica TaxID=281687 RepID=A0A8R1DSE2_CAEJA